MRQLDNGTLKTNKIVKIRKSRVKNKVETIETDSTLNYEKELIMEPVAYVTYGQSVTKNLGNYESAKYHVSISMPCDPKEVRLVAEQTVKEVVAILNDLEVVDEEIDLT